MGGRSYNQKMFDHSNQKVINHRTYIEPFDILISNTDIAKFIKTVPDESIDLIVTSPPYNIGKVYENRRKIDEYLEFYQAIIQECYRILKPSGSICWQVGNYVEKGEIYPLDIFFYSRFKDLGLKLRNRIIWHFGHGLHSKKRFSGRYETVLWFTKSDHYTFNLDAVRVPSKYPGKKHYKGSKRGLPSGNPLGKNPSDFWEFIASEFDQALWDIPNVKSNHPEKTEHPCQYPIELVERLVLALTEEGEVVFDPFMGVGSSLLAGLIHQRKVIGVDLEKRYVELAEERIYNLLSGNLKKRDLGKSVYQPKGTEKVCMKPDEWKQNQLWD
ncbi:DNA modification methylase [Dactylococcopsis salina PCC 8305]|uniref:Methyltransferase n=1 Tax=Dactylococcopsis salina (strain PCC 8305) TaxID=13035 RepID=K9YTZ9_DACS8|nr:site-specific DNA-methyltransferase [Dactylococcopsis salina]AFZ49982.1 DNA modification methylase [Dactylococcopsis salina PCC 8305]